MGDMNGRIGQRGSMVRGGGEGEEVEVKRVSEDHTVNGQGVRMQELLQAFGVVVMNGVGGGCRVGQHVGERVWWIGLG